MKANKVRIIKGTFHITAKTVSISNPLTSTVAEWQYKDLNYVSQCPYNDTELLKIFCYPLKTLGYCRDTNN